MTFKRCPCGTVRDEQGKIITCTKKHGTWSYQHDLPEGADGRRRTIRRGGFETQREARKALNESLVRLERGEHLPKNRLKVREYLDQWLASKAALRATTRRSYAETIELYLKPALGHLKLTELRYGDIEAMYAAVRQLGRPDADATSLVLQRLLEARKATAQRPLSDARIRRIHATLMSALNTAVRRHLIPSNPAEHVELAAGGRPKAVVWTDEQVSDWKATGRRPKVAVWTPAQTGAFLDAALDHRLYPLFHLIAYRGLRRGEAVGLRWVDVDLVAARMRVAQQVVQLGWSTEVGDPKTATGARAIPLDDRTVAVLRLLRERQAFEREAVGKAWVDNGLVFTEPDGTGLHPHAASLVFRQIYRAAGLPPIRLHDLRHTAASLALAAGVPMKVVSELLGHSSTVITADTYTSVLPEVGQAAAAAVYDIVPRGRLAIESGAVPERLDDDGADISLTVEVQNGQREGDS